MAGNTFFQPENGISQRIYKYLRDMTRKNHIKIFFKVGTKSPFRAGFWTHRKTKNPRSKKFRYRKVPTKLQTLEQDFNRTAEGF